MIPKSLQSHRDDSPTRLLLKLQRMSESHTQSYGPCKKPTRNTCGPRHQVAVPLERYSRSSVEPPDFKTNVRTSSRLCSSGALCDGRLTLGQQQILVSWLLVWLVYLKQSPVVYLRATRLYAKGEGPYLNPGCHANGSHYMHILHDTFLRQRDVLRISIHLTTKTWKSRVTAVTIT